MAAKKSKAKKAPAKKPAAKKAPAKQAPVRKITAVKDKYTKSQIITELSRCPPLSGSAA